MYKHIVHSFIHHPFCPRFQNLFILMALDGFGLLYNFQRELKEKNMNKPSGCRSAIGSKNTVFLPKESCFWSRT